MDGDLTIDEQKLPPLDPTPQRDKDLGLKDPKALPPELLYQDKEKKPRRMQTVYITRHAHSKSNESKGAWKNMKKAILNKSLPKRKDVINTAKWVKPTRLNWMNSELSKKGRQQIEVMRRHTRTFLKDHKVELIMHSDLKRAQKTFRSLFGDEADKLEIPVKIREDMREELFTEKIGYNDLEKRTAALLIELCTRPENVIHLVGHSKYFRTLIGDLSHIIPNATTWRIKISAGKVIGKPECIFGPEMTELVQKEILDEEHKCDDLVWLACLFTGVLWLVGSLLHKAFLQISKADND